ncbi:hypothetical protein E3N88_13572 [Mikania micrantha]|uniref:non-specific serine/threonine protein kinase n=1 Tax=Mikania micrantha TaxID=192012 RepID=A0A5N6P956_9ASTR|nr:hypothetical protein E3N88_13572 [Mikania micrantha]
MKLVEPSQQVQGCGEGCELPKVSFDLQCFNLQVLNLEEGSRALKTAMEVFMAERMEGSSGMKNVGQKLIDIWEAICCQKPLSIRRIKLTGGIPSFLGNVTSMEEFSAADNPMGGRIPDTLGRLKNLIHFGCGGCNLYGTIPHSIYNLSLLNGFSLGGNQLIGSLPSTIGETLPLLYVLQLSHNNLTGPIPPSISNCSMLTYLELQGNNFKGKLTIDFANLRDIIFAIFSKNNLYGHGEADELKFIDSLKNCSKLQKLELAYCNLQGTLPRSIGNLSSQLSYLSFEENKLHGNLPSSIGNLVGLTTLVLAYNQFTGNIPSTIGMLQNLQDVGLNNNQLSGPIPDTIGNLSMVIKLVISNNNLEGHIPSSLGKCRSLSLLALGNNKLSGNLPKQILQLPSLSIVLELSLNNLSGSLPEEIGNLHSLNYLILNDNSFSGNIPNTLGGCTSLVFLSLKRNFFQGMIPLSLRSLRGVITLDLSHNNLSGQIPQFLEQFMVETLDLSYNDFEGEVPMLGVFANTSAFSVSGNNRLCGGLVELGLPKCKKTKKHKKKKFPLFIAIGILIASMVLFAILCFIWHKKKSKGQPSQSSRNSGEMTSSGDVYSFGILLLEVMTGKNPTCGMFNEGLSIHKFVNTALPDHVTDIIDDDLLNYHQDDANVTKNTGAKTKKLEECLASILKIGVSCSMDSYTQRMNIETVVNELQHVRDAIQNI